MPPVEPRQRSTPPNPAAEQLPLLAGAKIPELQPGKFLDVPQVKAALQLVLAFDRSPMAQFVDLKRIDASSSEVLVITTGQGAEITFGLRIWISKCAGGTRFMIWPSAQAKGSRASTSL